VSGKSRALVGETPNSHRDTGRDATTIPQSVSPTSCSLREGGSQPPRAPMRAHPRGRPQPRPEVPQPCCAPEPGANFGPEVLAPTSEFAGCAGNARGFLAAETQWHSPGGGRRTAGARRAPLSAQGPSRGVLCAGQRGGGGGAGSDPRGGRARAVRSDLPRPHVAAQLVAAHAGRSGPCVSITATNSATTWTASSSTSSRTIGANAGLVGFSVILVCRHESPTWAFSLS